MIRPHDPGHRAVLATCSAQRGGAALHIQQALTQLPAVFIAATHPIGRDVQQQHGVRSLDRPSHDAERAEADGADVVGAGILGCRRRRVLGHASMISSIRALTIYASLISTSIS